MGYLKTDAYTIKFLYDVIYRSLMKKSEFTIEKRLFVYYNTTGVIVSGILESYKTFYTYCYVEKNYMIIPK